MADPNQNALSKALESAISAIDSHPAVQSVDNILPDDAGSTRVTATFAVNLPSRAAAAGQSDNGVRAEEPVEIVFDGNFPDSAPAFFLRRDFPRNLPHIYAHALGDPVPPCLTVGDPVDVLHSQGMYRLVSQMADWLDKAAINELTNSSQGWEPSRRRYSHSILMAHPDDLVPANPPWSAWKMFLVYGVGTINDDLWQTRDDKLAPHHGALTAAWLAGLLRKRETNDDVRSGPVPVVVCWPGATGPAGAAVHDTYQADTVTTLAELSARAAELGCATSFQNFVSNFNALARNVRDRQSLDLCFIFPIRRPLHIIGQQSCYEMLAYRTILQLPGTLKLDSAHTVKAVAMLTPVSSELLQRTSGIPVDVRPRRQWNFVGCGSLGSKVIMHLTRAGIRPSLLVDRTVFLAHNTARHALLPSAPTWRTKANLMADVVADFKMDSPAVFAKDVRALPAKYEKYRTKLWNPDAFVVNTTGSPAARSFLTGQPFTARVIEAALVNKGSGAYLTIEGPARSPNTSELMYHSYERMREHGLLRESPSINDSALTVGVGCHSVTMPISDARISLAAASVGQKLLNIEVQGPPETASAAVAVVGNDGMSASWQSETVGQTNVARVYDTEGWTVRVLEHAHLQILEDVARYPGRETGGLIVGGICSTTREIYITSVLPAPIDSQRSAGRFVLGVEGRAASIQVYEESAGGTLWCLGTWHSHLEPSGPSQMDKDTAKLLDGELRHAAVLLIRHPEGYAALVRDGAP
ncbi:Mov34/MPN/PAD-1 family protein [Cupriavidus sp. TMH.W2]|uniref:Mov34/MPN/PAD-1 family protein n=1 Tax=Cupriavidus sp. TMH.W2 TaxID=3434465 RepID=UPI003D778A48